MQRFWNLKSDETLTGLFNSFAGKLVRGVYVGAAFLVVLTVAGCSSQFSQHGHLLTDADVAQVQHGMSKQQVQYLLGTPDTTATYSGDVFYYISTKMKQTAFWAPEVVDRRVVAVYFNPQLDTVKRTAHYGLKDGKVIDFISRETPSHGSEASLLKQLFRNIGANQNVFGGKNNDPTAIP